MQKEFAFFRLVSQSKGRVSEKQRDAFFRKIANNPQLQESMFGLLDQALRSRSTTAFATIAMLVGENLDVETGELLVSNDTHILLDGLDRISELDVRFFWYLSHKIYTGNLSPGSDLCWFSQGENPTIEYTYHSDRPAIVVGAFMHDISCDGASAMINDMITRRLFLPYTGGMVGVGTPGTFRFAVGRVTKVAYEKIGAAMEAIDTMGDDDRGRALRLLAT